MNIFTRFVDIINANINSFLDQAEDPEKMIKLVITKIEDTIVEIRTSCSSALSAKAMNEKAMHEVQSEVFRWTERAEKAAQKNLDSLAMEALAEKKKATQRLEDLKADSEKYERMIESYKEDIAKLEEKLISARERYEKIHQHAEIEREAKRNNRNFDRFDRMEERIDRMTAESDAERKFRDLEEAEELKKELEELKARINAN